MREVADPVRGDRDHLLDPAPVFAFQVDAGFHGHDVARDQLSAGFRGQTGGFVDKESDAVPERMTECPLVFRLPVDDLAGDLVGFVDAETALALCVFRRELVKTQRESLLKRGL